jgi:ribosomal protein S19E (S16A)
LGNACAHAHAYRLCYQRANKLPNEDVERRSAARALRTTPTVWRLPEDDGWYFVQVLLILAQILLSFQEAPTSCNMLDMETGGAPERHLVRNVYLNIRISFTLVGDDARKRWFAATFT